MRLWHAALIPVLPRQQLLGQWRELCLIAKNIAERGTPNHILVNPAINYPRNMLDSYANHIYNEMTDRGYSVDWISYSKYRRNRSECLDCSVPLEELFPGWHDARYFWQCYFNLQEKYDRGGITEQEWLPVQKLAIDMFGNAI